MQKKPVGGSNPQVQERAGAARVSGMPGILARIYNPPAVVGATAEDDPRYPKKENFVENVYHPPAPGADKPRSGFTQVLNWLLHGTLK